MRAEKDMDLLLFLLHFPFFSKAKLFFPRIVNKQTLGKALGSRVWGLMLPGRRALTTVMLMASS